MNKEYVLYKLAQKTGVFETAGSAFDSVGKKVKEGISSVADSFQETAKKVGNFGKNMVNSVAEGTTGQTLGRYIDKGINNFGENLKNSIPDIRPKVPHTESSKNNQFAAASSTSVATPKFK